MLSSQVKFSADRQTERQTDTEGIKNKLMFRRWKNYPGNITCTLHLIFHTFQ